MRTGILGLCIVLSVTGAALGQKIVQVAHEGLKEPFGVGFAADGSMYVVEMAQGNRLLKINDDGVAITIAGQLEAGYSGDDGPPLEARFNGPHSLAVLPDGDVLIGDTWNGVVRQVAIADKTVNTLPGFQVPVEKAKSSGPYCIALDFTGKTLFVANLQQIHAIDLASGKARIVAGNGQKGIPSDGAMAIDAPLVDPRAAAPDRQGNLYILERGGHALRVVDRDGRIHTVVNPRGVKGNAGDGGPGLDAMMNGPKHLCIDRDDSVVIADAENHTIRRYDPKTKRIERLAGTGTLGKQGLGGDPLKCQLARPHGVTVHPITGELYIADSDNHRVLKIAK